MGDLLNSRKQILRSDYGYHKMLGLANLGLTLNDLDNFKQFMEYAKQFPVKILAGIILLTSAPMARFMNKNVAGVNVPQELIDEMASAPKGRALDKGIEIAGRMIKRIRDEEMCDGCT